MLYLAALSVLAAPMAAALACYEGLTGADFRGARYPRGLGASPPELTTRNGGSLMRNSGTRSVVLDGTAELAVDCGALGLVSGTTWHVQC